MSKSPPWAKAREETKKEIKKRAFEKLNMLKLYKYNLDFSQKLP